MSSDEGGVANTVSPSSTRRARLRRGTLAGRATEAVFFRAAGRLPDDDFAVFRLAVVFGAALRAVFRTVLRAALRAVGRLAARRLAVFFVDRVEAVARPPLDLAIGRCPFEP